ncbi:uncharacterized protein CIMG_11009 [Coccidioides immitis RS]|uniref:Uncharacterized protein n=1 Tax=Coccidioides immitis (strain RS) TaxID=246410 RepID=A0A0D8JRQ0_COCIM|nr:uncharacterized protein CIMG_11009 [Coccidioides immitis RS]KJF59967.1 hypothetical protein CIMG_11009 [Coccidioides immitis RS]
MNKDETETIEILLPRPLIGRLLNITLSKTDYGERYLGLVSFVGLWAKMIYGAFRRWYSGTVMRTPLLWLSSALDDQLKRPMAMALHAKPENTESTHHTGGGGDMYQTCALSRWRDLRPREADVHFFGDSSPVWPKSLV